MITLKINDHFGNKIDLISFFLTDTVFIETKEHK
jgi:hypothetical protein